LSSAKKNYDRKIGRGRLAPVSGHSRLTFLAVGSVLMAGAALGKARWLEYIS